MQILARLFTVVLLLSGLAYGSYSFGKYVLSQKLFGPSIKAAPGSVLATKTEPLARQTTLKSGKPQVDVQILPAEDAGPGPAPPSFDVTARELEKGEGSASSRDSIDPSVDAAVLPPTPTPRSRRARKLNVDDSGLDYSVGGLDDNADGDRRRNRDGSYSDRRDGGNRSRRRRRRRSYKRSSSGTSPASGDSSRDVYRDGSGTSDSSSGGEGGSSGRRSRSSDGAKRSTRSESPVPRPEGGSSGGESPVPQPE